MAEIAEPSRDAEHDLRRRTQILVDALNRRGLCGATYEEADENLRSHLAGLTMLASNPPAFLMFQDRQSLVLLKELGELATALDDKLEEIDRYSVVDTGEKINLCEFVLPQDDIEQLRCTMQTLRLARQRAEEIGLRAKRGRQTLPLFYEFVRRLHDLYEQRAGRKGFTEVSGTGAKGDFVEFVLDAQKMLPTSLQCDRKTIGSRVISAFAGTNLER
ncbi:hypothetical protein IVB14_23275 [Bradyrhizobium sp. 180]|uniref:hypothetical protein n=1 Tax=unclassified Bradyrhizobium TaxID=2631580 RepID=UPI001FF9AEC4|nr:MULTISPECIES: hypothetical protein [unclassified Bradyrhizobium]MCK1493272.1 hypothetical protein [Bradyrhizobium sp. 180]MCK1529000.1 hypothetical protein [Bradyrhizobium sp. 182]MCK1595863.1 hypothetical protein [Bradyrhizobium sp. 164]